MLHTVRRQQAGSRVGLLPVCMLCTARWQRLIDWMQKILWSRQYYVTGHQKHGQCSMFKPAVQVCLDH